MRIIWWNESDQDAVPIAADVILDDGVIINPTETIHGFAARFDRPESIKRIVELKGRDDRKPMNLLVPSVDWLEELGDLVPSRLLSLAEKFWPGGLSLIVKLKDYYRESFPWDSETISLRVSSNPFVLSLMDKIELPLVSTSLNLSGMDVLLNNYESGLDALLEEWNSSRVPEPELAVIDRALEGNKASTIVAVDSNGNLKLVREGAIDFEELKNIQ